MKAVLAIPAVLATVGVGGVASATTVQWDLAAGGNGHYYELVESVSLWSQANADAESRVLLGLAGHLASITSAAENDFLTTTLAPLASVGPQIQVWVGGYQPPGSPEPAGNWTWTSGEPWAYSNWSTPHVQPNNDGPGENFLVFYVRANPYALIGQWGDAQDSVGEMAWYIVEYSNPASLNPVPLPPAVWLFGSALGVMGVMRRKISA